MLKDNKIIGGKETLSISMFSPSFSKGGELISSSPDKV